MNTVPSLENLCLTTLADIKYHNPETIIPFDNVPSDIINKLCTLLVSDNQINVKMPPDGNVIEIYMPHKSSIRELVEKISTKINVPFSVIRLIFRGKGTSGYNENTLCEWFGVKVGVSLTCSLVFSHQTLIKNILNGLIIYKLLEHGRLCY